MIENHPVVFMYSGQGSQYYQMGKALFDSEPKFRASMEELDEQVKNKLNESIIEHIYSKNKKKSDSFTEILITHQAIFMIEYALTKMLISKGVTPSYLLGASLGEIVAAAVSGILTPDACIELMIKNAEAVTSQCSPGGMLAILANNTLYFDEPILRDNSELASINFESHFVVAGDSLGLKKIADYLKIQGMDFQFIDVAYGFHSKLMNPIKASLQPFLQALSYKQGTIPLVSCTQQQVLQTLTDSHFWEVFRQPVEFWQTIQAMEQKDNYIYIDLGPSGTLATFTKYTLSPASQSSTFPLLTPFGQDINNLKKIYNLFQISESTN